MKKTSKALRRSVFIASLAIIVVSLVEDLSSPMEYMKRMTTTSTASSKHNAFYDHISNNLGNITEPLKETDTPVYWHIAKSAGTSMKDYYGCLGLVEATGKGRIRHSNDEPELRVHEHLGGYYLNVDLTSEDGVKRAAKLGLAESGLADIVVAAPFRRAVQFLFSPDHQGRSFAMFRHPIERDVSLFYYHQIATWEKHPDVYRADLAGMDIDTWLESGEFHEDLGYGNYVTYSILGKGPLDVLTDDDLELAKEILRTKFIVGLVSKMEESVERFDKYFGWHDKHKEKRPGCYQTFAHQGANKNTHKHVQEGSKAWNTLKDLASYDMQLYEYAEQLYEEQAEIFLHLDNDKESEEKNEDITRASN